MKYLSLSLAPDNEKDDDINDESDVEDDGAAGGDDYETIEQLEEEEEVVSTSVRESEIASDDENEFLGDFSNTNCESIVLYRWRWWLKLQLQFILSRTSKGTANQEAATLIEKRSFGWLESWEELLGSLSKRRFWAKDDNRKWAVFQFNLSSHYRIYIVRNLFTSRDG